MSSVVTGCCCCSDALWVPIFLLWGEQEFKMILMRPYQDYPSASVPYYSGIGGTAVFQVIGPEGKRAKLDMLSVWEGILPIRATLVNVIRQKRLDWLTLHGWLEEVCVCFHPHCLIPAKEMAGGWMLDGQWGKIHKQRNSKLFNIHTYYFCFFLPQRTCFLQASPTLTWVLS